MKVWDSHTGNVGPQLPRPHRPRQQPGVQPRRPAPGLGKPRYDGQGLGRDATGTEPTVTNRRGRLDRPRRALSPDREMQPCPRSRRTTRRRGFTLIELLVVIAIIADPDRPAAARRPEGPRGRRPHELRQQPQATRAGVPQLPRRPRQVSPGGGGPAQPRLPAIPPPEAPRARDVPAAVPGTGGARRPVPLGRLLVRPAEPAGREHAVESLAVPVGAGEPGSGRVAPHGYPAAGRSRSTARPPAGTTRAWVSSMPAWSAPA